MTLATVIHNLFFYGAVLGICYLASLERTIFDDLDDRRRAQRRHSQDMAHQVRR